MAILDITMPVDSSSLPLPAVLAAAAVLVGVILAVVLAVVLVLRRRSRAVPPAPGPRPAGPAVQVAMVRNPVKLGADEAGGMGRRGWRRGGRAGEGERTAGSLGKVKKSVVAMCV